MLHKWLQPTSLPHCFPTGITLDLIWVGDLPAQSDRSFSMWLQGIWPWRGRMKSSGSRHSLLRLGLNSISSLPMAVQKEEPSLRGEILTSWNCFSSISHSVSWLFHDLFMVTGSECPTGSRVLGGDEDSNADQAHTDPEGSPSAHVVSEIDTPEKCKCAMAVFTLWAFLQAIPMSKFPVMCRLAGAWHFQRKRSSCSIFAMGTEWKWLVLNKLFQWGTQIGGRWLWFVTAKTCMFYPGGGQTGFNKTPFIMGKVLTQKEK